MTTPASIPRVGMGNRPFVCGLLVLVLGVGELLAATYTVTHTGSLGAGSLRQAVLDAEANPGPDIIEFAPALAGQTILLGHVGDSGNAFSALGINTEIEIRNTTGSNITIARDSASNYAMRIFNVRSGGNLTLVNVTIDNGLLTFIGGANIASAGTFTAKGCTIKGGYVGYNTNPLTGGGGLLVTAGTATLINCTVTANYSGGHAGGIACNSGASLNVFNCTITGNSGGGVRDLNSSGTTVVRNTILGSNSFTPAAGSGNNIDAALALPAALAANGGPTETMAIGFASPAGGAGTYDPAVLTDQRGMARRNPPDIGAFELQRIAPQITSANAATFTAGTSNSFTFTASGTPTPIFTTASSLPAGVTLSPSGVLSGTPSTGGVFPLTIIAANGAAPDATQAFTLTVGEISSLVVNTANDTAAIDGVTSLREALAYAQSLGGAQTITFAPALAGQNILLNAGATGASDDTALRVNSGVITIDGGTGVTLHMTVTGRRHLLVRGGAALTLKNLALTGGDLRGVNDGAAVWNGGSLTINNCRLTGNQANNGGALWSGGTLVMTASLVESNSASVKGGGVGSSGAVNISGCTFTRNTSQSEGGALHCWGGSPSLAIVNSTFAGNSATGPGGAIVTGANTNTLTHVTIVDNTAANGAYWQWQTAATFINTIVARNFNGATPSDVTTFGTGTLTPASANNLIGTGGSGGLVNGVNGNIVGIAPANLYLGALANNGGSTPTIAVLTGSPAANAGVTNAGVSSTDQRGISRPTSSGLLGRFYAVLSPSTTLLSPLSNLEALAPVASAIAPRVDFGAGTEGAPGNGSGLDRSGTSGNPFGGLGVNVGLDNFAALWSGFITVPESADYRFTTRSDDGSVLYVDGQLVVNNNFFQPMNNASGTVSLSAGRHVLRIGYFEATGEAGMQLSWEQLTGSSPFVRQIVPPAALSIGTTPDIGAFQHIPAEIPAPLVNPANGIYEGSVTVSLSTTTAGATIRYTTDGSTPTETHGDTYTTPFSLAANATVRAIAVAGGWFPSSVTAVSYDLRTALASWRALHGLDRDGSQDFQNPSGDGVANIAKYAFNLAPNSGNLLNSDRTVLPANGIAGLPAITADTTPRLVFQFVRRKASTNPGIGYLVETSPDLFNWNVMALSNAVVQSIDATWERVTITDTNSTSMRFGRVKLVRFDAYKNNFNTNLGSASLRGTAVWTNQAVQLTDTIGGQLGAVVFDGVYAGPALNGFTARFNMNLGPAGQPVPADGISFVVGDLGAGAWGEMGPGTARNLTINFDTYNNGGDAGIGIHMFANGVTPASNPLNPFTDGTTLPVEINYDAGVGVTVKFNGTTIFNQVSTPGFVLPTGSKFGIGGRTGGAVERAVVDDFEIIPR